MTVKDNRWPSPVKPSNLREHFATTYRLDANQVEIMLDSSAKSLENTLDELQKAIDDELGYAEISRLGHSLKGVLLNMGELEWAELARFIEKSAGAGKNEKYSELVNGLRKGVESFLNRSRH